MWDHGSCVWQLHRRSHRNGVHLKRGTRWRPRFCCKHISVKVVTVVVVLLNVVSEFFTRSALRAETLLGGFPVWNHATRLHCQVLKTRENRSLNRSADNPLRLISSSDLAVEDELIVGSEMKYSVGVELPGCSPLPPEKGQYCFKPLAPTPYYSGV